MEKLVKPSSYCSTIRYRWIIIRFTSKTGPSAGSFQYVVDPA